MTVVDLFAGPGGWDLGARWAGLDTLGFEYDADACATRTAAGHPTIRCDLATYQLPDSADITGLIGSPPCPMFSAAGTREGVQWLPHLCEVAAGITDLSPDAPPEAALSLKPLEWVLRHRPRWVALEQVPDVVVLWGAVAGRLRSEGYSTWTGVLNSANYGVPQTRQRAILIASLDRVALPPEPTHDRNPEPSLFGELAPWVTMAEALGLRPETTVNLGSAYGEGDKRHPDYDLSDRWTLRAGSDAGHEPARRPDTEPAPTLAFGNAASDWVFERPATTIAGDPRVWPPGHKINQDDIDRLGATEAAERYGDRAGTAAVRLTEPQALTLQSFPHDYPIQGDTKRSRWKQIGNAVPPLLAQRVLAQVAS